MTLAVPLTSPGLWLTGIERGLLLGGLALALGGLAGRGLARQYIAARERESAGRDADAGKRAESAPAPLPAPWALRGSLAGCAAACAPVLTALAGPGLAAKLAVPPVAGLGSGATLPIAAVQAGCFALAAIALRLRQPGLSVLPLLGVACAEALRGHPEGIITAAGALLTLCHLIPAVLWAGMLAYVLRAAVAWRGDQQAMHGLIGLYARAAAWLFAVVVVTGLASAVLLVPLGSLLTTSYGLVLVVKAALVAMAAGLAIAGRARLRKAGSSSAAKHSAGPARATRAEAAALAAILVITGILTVLAPPAHPL